MLAAELELELAEHGLQETDLCVLEEREEALSFGRERKLGECFRRVGGTGF